MTVLLQGIGGSVAHGLAGPDSDVDRYGVYAAPTLDLVVPFSEDHPRAIHVEDSDGTLWEAGHFITLLATCNPSVMQLLWLPENLYEVMTPYGRWLIDLRTDVLNAEDIRDRYAGMVREQMRRLINEKRQPQAAKLVRHGLRMAEEAKTLLRTGRLVVGLPEPERFRRFDSQPWDAWNTLYEARNQILDATSDVMPANREAINLGPLRGWIRSVRLAHLT